LTLSANKKQEYIDLMHDKLKRTFYITAPIYKRYKKWLDGLDVKHMNTAIYRDFIDEINGLIE